MPDIFDPYLDRWQLIPDGDRITSHAGNLLPVLKDGQQAMLKVSHEPDEQAGAAILEYWAGEGAAPVLAREGDGLLLERATGPRSLSQMARGTQDDEATLILCEVARELHRPRAKVLPELVPLEIWFRELAPAADNHGGILRRCHQVAEKLLADQSQIVPLHGDLHHDNVLDFGEQGWLAIDPKGLWGERAFDYANIFTNPDLADPSQHVAIRPGVFARRLDLVTRASGLERRRLLEWILAWTGLSAAWYLGDDHPDAAIDLAIAEQAAAALDN